MKLLLTSAGLFNPTLRKTFIDLVSKKPSDINIAFIPTAANPEVDKWFIKEDLKNLKLTGVENITEVDISQIEEKGKWVRVLKDTDVIWIDGGNTFYLLKWLRQSGLDKEIRGLLEDKVYVGVSAGSLVAGPNIEAAGWDLAGDPNIVDLKDLTALKLVDFAVFPHFEKSQRERLEIYSREVSYPVYVLDNEMAVLVVGDKIDFVGEGEAFKA